MHCTLELSIFVFIFLLKISTSVLSEELAAKYGLRVYQNQTRAPIRKPDEAIISAIIFINYNLLNLST